ncbi:MAG: hypothetical protein ACP5MV_04220 [Candidatus Parvarchaeum sp.]
MSCISLNKILEIASEEQKEEIETNKELKRKVNFLADKKTGLKDIYKRLIYREKEKHYIELDEKQFDRYETLKGIVKNTLEAGIAGTMTGTLLYTYLGSSLQPSVYISVFLSSASLYGVSAFIYKRIEKTFGKELARKGRNLIEALNDLYLIKSKEYKNAFYPR